MRKSEDGRWGEIRRAAHWSEAQARWVVTELKRSGQSTRRFASEHDVGLQRLYYWQARLRTHRPPERASGELVEVRVPRPRALALAPLPAPGERIEIELSSGRRLSVAESIELERLGALVTLLERA